MAFSKRLRQSFNVEALYIDKTYATAEAQTISIAILGHWSAIGFLPFAGGEGGHLAPSLQPFSNSFGAICWVPYIKSSVLLRQSAASDFHGLRPRARARVLRLGALEPSGRSFPSAAET